MRSLLSSILALSLLLNAWCWLKLENSNDGFRVPPRARAAVADEGAEAKARTRSGPVTAPFTLPVDQAPMALCDWMRQLGVPEPVVRRAIEALLAEPRMQRTRDFLRAIKQSNAARAPGTALQDSFSPPQQNELTELTRQEKQALQELFGSSASLPDLERPFWNYLKPENVEAVTAIVKDHEAGLVRMPLSQHGLAYQELLDELSGRLSPEELAEFDRREGYTSQRLGSRFESFPGTEEERLAVFGIMSQFHLARAVAGESASPDELSTLDGLLRTRLGSDSYAAWQATLREDYGALRDIQRRFDVPKATLAQVEKLVFGASKESMAIVSNTALNDEQRAAAFRALAETTRSEVRRHLGANIGDGYLSVAQKTWLKRLDEGQAFGFTKKGAFYLYVVNPPPSASPPPRN